MTTSLTVSHATPRNKHFVESLLAANDPPTEDVGEILPAFFNTRR